MYDLLVRGGTVIDGTGRVPFTADVAVQDGRIVEVGTAAGPAKRTIDADGALVTPGWVDAHTHYDGQVTWDDRIEGSATNGVTTVVMGNCGVGFAPVRAAGTGELIDMMEGVEDIPGSALSEGIPWGAWESFPEYLDFLATRRWAVDVAAQIPHGALRYYVMGERAISSAPADAEDIAQLARLAADAVEAGAVGFSSSRTMVHRSMRRGEFVPGTFAPMEELLAIARAIAGVGGAVLQAIPASGSGVGEVTPAGPEHATVLQEAELFAALSRESGLPVVFTTMQVAGRPTGWRDVLESVARSNAVGSRLRPMIATRAVSMLSTLAAYHVFMLRPTYRRLAETHTFDALVREMRRPDVKAAILSEEDVPHRDLGSMENGLSAAFRKWIGNTYPLREPLDYEPLGTSSFEGLGAVARRDPFDVLYDFLLEDDGTAVAVQLGSNYLDQNLDACREMLLDPNTVTGLSDAGAHVKFVCDMSAPTFNLTHWTRDRSRGPGLPIENVVAKTTSVPARIWGFHDRGVVAAGKRADLNVIDHDRLAIGRPELRFDLPAGGGRFLQKSSGYLATIVAGELTRENDIDTGMRPGRLARRGSTSAC